MVENMYTKEETLEFIAYLRTMLDDRLKELNHNSFYADSINDAKKKLATFKEILKAATGELRQESYEDIYEDLDYFYSEYYPDAYDDMEIDIKFIIKRIGNKYVGKKLTESMLKEICKEIVKPDPKVYFRRPVLVNL